MRGESIALRRSTMADYEAVVIGAGNGGLTAALTLARKGLKVLLLERHNVPGGCATSFVRGRFEFEVALHQLSGMGTEKRPGPLRSILGELGVLDKVEFVEMEDLYRFAIPGECDLTLKANRLAAINVLKEKFPDEHEAIDRFFDLVYKFCKEMVAVAFMRDPEASWEKYPTYFKYALKTSQKILDEHFRNPFLKAALSAYWGYMGLPPRLLPFGDLAVLLWAYIEFKPFHIKGSSQALSNGILECFLQAGGEARFNCGAKKILLRDGRIRGVRTEEGDEAGTRYVVSNASTLGTYLELIGEEHVPEGVLNTLGTKTIGPSAFTVFLGMDCPPEKLGIHETTNFIGTDIDADQGFARWRTLEPPDFMGLSCYNVSDPDFSPPGTCQVVLVQLQYLEPWLGVPPTRYVETKFKYARGMLDLVEKVFPGFRGHIEEMEAATPLTHMRYLGHPAGAIYGFDQYAKDSPLFEERRSSIPGLFFAGAWVGSGGYQPTLMSGVSAAKAVLKSLAKN
jgi:prolycopene isomerase